MRVYQDGRAAAAGVAVSVLGGLLLGPVGMASHGPVAPPAHPSGGAVSIRGLDLTPGPLPDRPGQPPGAGPGARLSGQRQATPDPTSTASATDLFNPPDGSAPHSGGGAPAPPPVRSPPLGPRAAMG